MVSPPSCHQELVQARDVGGSADWRSFQLSTITSLHSRRQKVFAGGSEGSGGDVGISKDVEWGVEDPCVGEGVVTVDSGVERDNREEGGRVSRERERRSKRGTTQNNPTAERHPAHL